MQVGARPDGSLGVAQSGVWRFKDIQCCLEFLSRTEETGPQISKSGASSLVSEPPSLLRSVLLSFPGTPPPGCLPTADMCLSPAKTWGTWPSLLAQLLPRLLWNLRVFVSFVQDKRFFPPCEHTGVWAGGTWRRDDLERFHVLFLLHVEVSTPEWSVEGMRNPVRMLGLWP